MARARKAALLTSSTVLAFGSAPPPTMPSADFCAAVRSLYGDLSPVAETQRRPPEVRSTAFAACPPNLPPRPLMALDFAITCSLVRTGRPRYPVLVHRAAALLHAFFKRHLTMTLLPFANPSPPSGWIEDFHLQAVDHTRHTTKRAAPLPGGPILSARNDRGLLHPLAPDRDVAELRPLHLVGAVDVAQIDDHRARHYALEPSQIERAELLPFGGDDDGIGAVGGGIGAVAIFNGGQKRFDLLHAGRIVAAHRGAEVVQRGDQRDRRRIAGIVGIRLEGQAEYGDGLAAHRTVERRDHLARHGAFALLVDGGHRLDDAQRHTAVLRGLQQRAGVLGETRAAEAGTGVQKFRADAVV